MPIIGLTDRTAQFPKIGDIRKGAAKTGNAPGRDLDHFRAVFPEDEAEAAAVFVLAYGDKPREINVLLPFAEIDRNFEAWREEYVAGGLVHRCDGETCVIWRDAQGEMRRTPKPCPGGCKATGRLKVIIPELRRLAYIEVHTTSVWDIVELTANLESLSKLTRNGISGIPLVLKRRSREISTPVPKEPGKRARRTKWLLSIEAEPRWVDAKLTAMQLEALPLGAQLPALAAPAVIDTDFEDDETGEVAAGDWDEGVFEDAEKQDEPTPEPEPEPEPAILPRGEQPPVQPPAQRLVGWRPYPPAKIKAGIDSRIAKAVPVQQTGHAGLKPAKFLTDKLIECFAPDENADVKALAVLTWLTGPAQWNEITLAQYEAVSAWLLDKASAADGSFDLHPAAPAEAAAILAVAQRESGQAEMF